MKISQTTVPEQEEKGSACVTNESWLSHGVQRDRRQTWKISVSQLHLGNKREISLRESQLSRCAHRDRRLPFGGSSARGKNRDMSLHESQLSHGMQRDRQLIWRILWPSCTWRIMTPTKAGRRWTPRQPLDFLAVVTQVGCRGRGTLQTWAVETVTCLF